MSCYIGTIFTTYIKVVNSRKTQSDSTLCSLVNACVKQLMKVKNTTQLNFKSAFSQACN